MDLWGDLVPDEERDCVFCEGTGWVSTESDVYWPKYHQCDSCGGYGKGSRGKK